MPMNADAFSASVVDPSSVQVVPSEETYASKRLPVRESRSQFGIGISCMAAICGLPPVVVFTLNSAPSFTPDVPFIRLSDGRETSDTYRAFGASDSRTMRPARLFQ